MANLLETGNLHPTPATALSGLQQMFGDVWEWTAVGYTGYPGYKPLPGALGEYNGKFMSSQMVLRGGSCVTPATHIRATYRNFFPPAPAGSSPVCGWRRTAKIKPRALRKTLQARGWCPSNRIFPPKRSILLKIHRFSLCNQVDEIRAKLPGVNLHRTGSELHQSQTAIENPRVCLPRGRNVLQGVLPCHL